MGGLDRKPGGSSLVAEPGGGAVGSGAVGKHTLVEQLDSGGHSVQRKPDAVSEATAILSGRGPDTAASALANLPSGGGAPLDRGIAAGVQRATGGPLGDVRVHQGPASAAAAHAISARAFTTGNNIHLGAQASPSDASLMSHEAAHTIQQTQGAKVEAGVAPSDHPLEAEADRVAEAATSGGHASVTVGAGGSIMRDAVSDVESALSYGAFDWAITDADATRALSISTRRACSTTCRTPPSGPAATRACWSRWVPRRCGRTSRVCCPMACSIGPSPTRMPRRCSS